MAPTLEEELVSQIVSTRNEQDTQYLSDRIEALGKLGFKVDERAVQTALRRYELMQAYNSQDNSKRAIKKAEKEKLKQIGEKEIEKLKNGDSSIVATELHLTRQSEKCWRCESDNEMRRFEIKYDYIQKNVDGLTKKSKWLLMGYCFACGKVIKM